MDCNTARMLTTFFGRHGSELAPEDAAALNAHVAACPKCAAALRFERAFDDRIAKAMLAVPVPAGLKGKLIDGIAAQRGSWYRQKAYALVATAAVLLLAVGGFAAWQLGTAPELTLSEIVNEADRQHNDRPGHVRAFLASAGVAFHPERPLDLNLADSWGIKQLRGKSVPAVELTHGAKNARATVYVVRSADFNWQELPRDGSSVPSMYGFQVAVLKDLKRSDVVYVVVFTGPGVDAFLENRESL